MHYKIDPVMYSQTKTLENMNMRIYNQYRIYEGTVYIFLTEDNVQERYDELSTFLCN